MKDEQDNHRQQNWYVRLERERQDLSTSVSQTLEEPFPEDPGWPDGASSLLEASRAQARTRYLEPAEPFPTGQLAVITTDTVSGSEKSSTREWSEIPRSVMAQQTSKLVRFAQRLTSLTASLVAIGGNKRTTEIKPQGPDTPQQIAFPHDSLVPPSQFSMLSHNTGAFSTWTPTPLPQENEAVPSPSPDVSSLSAILPAVPLSQLRSAPPRLAGHTAKIRLQTTSLPAIPATEAKERSPQDIPVSQPPSQGLQEINNIPGTPMIPPLTALPILTLHELPAMPTQEKGNWHNKDTQRTVAESLEETFRKPMPPATLTAEVQSPIMSPAQQTEVEEKKVEAVATTTLINPDIDEVARPVQQAGEPQLSSLALSDNEEKIPPSSMAETPLQLNSVQGLTFGSGAFESGQRDATVANAHVTNTSVVLLMLAGNPGPVVMQYISLKPHEGFIAHLTAPAMAKTPFNYVILSGGL